MKYKLIILKTNRRFEDDELVYYSNSLRECTQILNSFFFVPLDYVSIFDCNSRKTKLFYNAKTVYNIPDVEYSLFVKKGKYCIKKNS